MIIANAIIVVITTIIMAKSNQLYKALLKVAFHINLDNHHRISNNLLNYKG